MVVLMTGQRWEIGKVEVRHHWDLWCGMRWDGRRPCLEASWEFDRLQHLWIRVFACRFFSEGLLARRDAESYYVFFCGLCILLLGSRGSRSQERCELLFVYVFSFVDQLLQHRLRSRRFRCHSNPLFPRLALFFFVNVVLTSVLLAVFGELFDVSIVHALAKDGVSPSSKFMSPCEEP